MCKTVTVLDAADHQPLPAPAMEDRPVCPGCEKPRNIKINDEKTHYHYEGYGYFCSLRCATGWANREVKRRADKALSSTE